MSQTQDKYTADENIVSDGALTDPICPARSLLLDNDNFHQASLLTYLLQSFVILKSIISILYLTFLWIPIYQYLASGGTDSPVHQHTGGH